MEIWVVKESVKEQIESLQISESMPAMLMTPAISIWVMPDSFFAEMTTKEGEPVGMIRLDTSKLKLIDPSPFRYGELS